MISVEQIFVFGFILVAIIVVSGMMSVWSLQIKMAYEDKKLKEGYVRFRDSDTSPFVWVHIDDLVTYTACLNELISGETKEEEK